MLEHAAYRQLASINRLIVEGRERVDQQKKRVVTLAERPDRRNSVVHLRELQRSLRLMIYGRSILIKQLIRSPF